MPLGPFAAAGAAMESIGYATPKAGGPGFCENDETALLPACSNRSLRQHPHAFPAFPTCAASHPGVAPGTQPRSHATTADFGHAQALSVSRAQRSESRSSSRRHPHPCPCARARQTHQQLDLCDFACGLRVGRVGAIYQVWGGPRATLQVSIPSPRVLGSGAVRWIFDWCCSPCR